MNNAPVGILVADAEGIALWCNKAVTEMINTTMLSVVGKPVDHLVCESDRVQFRSMLKGLEQEGESGLQLRLQGEEKKYPSVNIQASYRPAFPSENNVEASSGDQILFSISSSDEISRIHDAPGMSDDGLQNIIDTMVDALITSDERGNIESFNKAAEQMFGYSAEEVRGQNVSILMPRARADEHDRYVEDYKRTGEKRIIGIGREELAMRKDGTTFPIDLAISEPRAAGARKFTAVIRDISERRAFEDELIRARMQAEDASKAKSEFLARMNHELRTPMNAILGFVQLLQLDHEQFNHQQQEMLDLIYSSGRHLLELINDVLDLASIESRGIQVRLETVQLHELIKECVGIIGPMTQKREIGISYDGTAYVDRKIVADRLRLKEVLINLLSNAVKYNKDQGDITIACEELAGDHLKISVTDTGIGLTKEQQQKVFKPFERLGAEWSEVKGTGLGLSISKHIMESMGGGIGFSSQAGEGSSFWIEMDATGAEVEKNEAAAPVVQAPDVAAINKAGGPYTVLYVEDNYSNQRLMEFMFENRDEINLVTALTPEHGLRLARELRPNLILTDIFLPRIDGFELYKLLQEDECTRAIPVIGVSAQLTQEVIERGLKNGFHSFVTKPIELDKFHTTINDAL